MLVSQVKFVYNMFTRCSLAGKFSFLVPESVSIEEFLILELLALNNSKNNSKGEYTKSKKSFTVPKKQNP